MVTCDHLITSIHSCQRSLVVRMTAPPCILYIKESIHLHFIHHFSPQKLICKLHLVRSKLLSKFFPIELQGITVNFLTLDDSVFLIDVDEFKTDFLHQS